MLFFKKKKDKDKRDKNNKFWRLGAKTWHTRLFILGLIVLVVGAMWYFVSLTSIESLYSEFTAKVLIFSSIVAYAIYLKKSQ